MIKINLPIDKSRFFLELIKYNSETLIKNISLCISREFIEVNFKKGLVILTSPYLSGLLTILNKNGQNIFQSLHKTYFLTSFYKTTIIQNLFLLGTGFLSSVRFIIFTNEKFNFSKVNKISETFLNLRLIKKNCIQNEISFASVNSRINFLLYGKFILLDLNFLFFKKNPLLVWWILECIRVVKISKNFKKKKCSFSQYKFIKILNLPLQTCFLLKKHEKNTKTEQYKNWNPDLYENCLNQVVYLNSDTNTTKQIGKSDMKLLIGSNMFYNNFEINCTGIEKTIKNSQKHLTPVYFQTIKSVENKLCNIEEKKKCLESYLNSFQFYSINKIEILEKRFGGYFFKSFFQFNLSLPKSFVSSNREFSILKTNIVFKKLLNRSAKKNFSMTYFLIIRNSLICYFTRTDSNFLLDIVYFLAKKAIDKFTKINVFFIIFKLFKNINKSSNKNNFGRICEDFIHYFTNTKKSIILGDFYSNRLNSNRTIILKYLRRVLVHFYFEYGLKNSVLKIVRGEYFFLVFFKTLFFKIGNNFRNLLLRKYLNQSGFRKKISLLITLARLNKNLKLYEVCFFLYSKIRALMKYSIGIVLNEKGKFFHAKKQILISVSLKPSNKKSFFFLGLFSFRNRDFSTSIKSFNIVLNEEPTNKFARNNLEICIISSLNPIQIVPGMLKNFMNRPHTPFFLVLKICYYYLNRKKFRNFLIFNLIVNIISSGKNRIAKNLNFLKGLILFLSDFIRKKTKIFLYNKNSKLCWVNKNFKLNLNSSSHYKEFCLQLNHDSKLFQNIMRSLSFGSSKTFKHSNFTMENGKYLLNLKSEISTRFSKNWC